jgi:hypothetical protein
MSRNLSWDVQQVAIMAAMLASSFVRNQQELLHAVNKLRQVTGHDVELVKSVVRRGFESVFFAANNSCARPCQTPQAVATIALLCIACLFKHMSSSLC